MRISDWSSDVCSSDLVEPTIEEWDYAIDYLTRTGQICDDKRQEYILLSDVLGVSMLVDSINHRMPEGVTETTVLGPFFVADAPEMKSGANITNGMEGQPLYVMGRVIAPTGAPLADALVRSEERRVGQEWVSTCRSRCSR